LHPISLATSTGQIKKYSLINEHKTTLPFISTYSTITGGGWGRAIGGYFETHNISLIGLRHLQTINQNAGSSACAKKRTANDISQDIIKLWKLPVFQQFILRFNTETCPRQ
jgi:hypothetical protein